MSKFLLAILGLVAATLWLAILAVPNSNNLKIIACDVGQGDAILLTQKNTQILIDGGRGASVTHCLSSHIPFWDRNIELVVLSHPQADHYEGLIEVFRSYNVEAFLGSELDNSSQGYQVLLSEMAVSQPQIITSEKGKQISIGLIYLDILHPDTDFIKQNSVSANTVSSGRVLGIRSTDRDLNDFSVVVKVSFKDFDALFTGDIGPAVSSHIINNHHPDDVEYIKVPHHGSKNGLTEQFLRNFTPEIAVISVGKNQWGHPHEEVIRLLNDQGVKILRTDLDGEVAVETDGQKWWIKNY